MKKIIILLVFAVTICGFSQTKENDNNDLRISYRLDYKKFETSASTLSNNAILIVNDQGSLFTFEAMMNLDTIQQERKLTMEDALLYRSPYYFLIKSRGEFITHYEEIGNERYKVEEKVIPNWKLVNKDTLIHGYDCKKAVLNHLGRDWIAWYTTKMPVFYGPYKFHGLPGLIMNIKDSEDTFNFIVNEIKTGKFETNQKVINFFLNDESDEGTIKFEPLKSDDFYKIRSKFNQMSLDDKTRYMNRNKLDGATNVIVTDPNSGERINTSRKSKLKNFLERYE